MDKAFEFKTYAEVCAFLQDEFQILNTTGKPYNRDTLIEITSELIESLVPTITEHVDVVCDERNNPPLREAEYIVSLIPKNERGYRLLHKLRGE